jgi:hypothetical protein
MVTADRVLLLAMAAMGGGGWYYGKRINRVGRKE